MARGDSKQFSYYNDLMGEGVIDHTSDVLKWVFITESYASVVTSTVDAKLSDFTQVASSGNYVANSTIANTTWTFDGSQSTLDGDDWTFAADPSNPTTARCVLIYNDSTVSKNALKVVDLTTDGTTPVDTTTGAFTYTVNASGLASWGVA